MGLKIDPFFVGNGLEQVKRFFASLRMTIMNIFGFLKEVKGELVKVAWPSREQTIRYTILVIIVAATVGLFLGGLDYILTAITAFFLNK